MPISTRARVWSAAGGAVLVLAALPVLAYVAPFVVGADAALVVLSGSMEPAFGPGDIILLHTVPFDDVRAGDVITFRSAPGSSVTYTHRVIEVIEDQRGRVLQTQGDANEDPDPMQVTESMLVGRQHGLVPWYGHVVVHLSGRLTYLLMSVLSLVAIALEVPRLFVEPEVPRRFSVVAAKHAPRRFEVVAR